MKLSSSSSSSPSSSSSHTQPHSTSSSSSSSPSSSLYRCESAIYNTLDTCIDLVLNSMSVSLSAHTEVVQDKNEVVENAGTCSNIEKEVVEAVEVVSEVVFNDSLTVFLGCIQTLHSTLFKKGVNEDVVERDGSSGVCVSVCGVSQYLSLSLSYPSSSSSGSRLNGSSVSSSGSDSVSVSNNMSGGEERAVSVSVGEIRIESKSVVESKSVREKVSVCGMLSPDWIRAISLTVRTVISIGTLLLTNATIGLPGFVEVGLKRGREALIVLVGKYG